jgi:hypothetical protein
MPASAASASAASAPSTLAMSPDRGAVGKLVGNLYIAAKTLLEGQSVNIETVRHEMRTLLGSASSSTSTNSSSGPSGAAAGAGSGTSAAAPASAAAPGTTSPMDWKACVTRLLLATQGMPNSIGCITDGFKRELAAAIQQGRQLCAGSRTAVAEALKRIDKAARIYRTLSGASYL